MKNLILISIAAFSILIVLILFVPCAKAASFEPLGPSRTLGDVYDDLMTVNELNQYIDSQGLSNSTVHTNGGQVSSTLHTLNSPHQISDIINTSGLDVFDSGSNPYASWLTHIIMIKGGVSKYSYANISQYANSGGSGRYIRVYHNGFSFFNNSSTNMFGRPVNISISESAAQVPEPSIIYLMLACLLPVGLRRLKSCI